MVYTRESERGGGVSGGSSRGDGSGGGRHDGSGGRRSGGGGKRRDGGSAWTVVVEVAVEVGAEVAVG